MVTPSHTIVSEEGPSNDCAMRELKTLDALPSANPKPYAVAAKITDGNWSQTESLNRYGEYKKDSLYRDEYCERVQAMLDEKSKGQEITVTAPEAPARGQIIDLMQALKQSIEKAKPKQAAPAQRKRKTAASDS
jgi:hypothetical protein